MCTTLCIFRTILEHVFNLTIQDHELKARWVYHMVTNQQRVSKCIINLLKVYNKCVKLNPRLLYIKNSHIFVVLYFKNNSKEMKKCWNEWHIFKDVYYLKKKNNKYCRLIYDWYATPLILLSHVRHDMFASWMTFFPHPGCVKYVILVH